MLNKPTTIRTLLNSVYSPDSINPITNAIIAIDDAISKYTETANQASNQQSEIANIEGIDEIYHQQYLESVIEENIYILEDLLGIALVICQTDIAYIVSKVKQIKEYCTKNYNYSLVFPSDKQEVLLRGPRVMSLPITKTQIMDAFANYFKHKEEWIENWLTIYNYTGKDSKKKQQKKTVELLQATGAIEHSSYNFRLCAEILGNKEFSRTITYIELLNDLRKVVRHEIELELRTKGILS